MERFTRREVLRILDIPEKQLAYWERLGLVRPEGRWSEKLYRYQDLISLRTVKQLTAERVPARRLQRAVAALKKQLAGVQAPLSELRILSDGRDIAVEIGGRRLEPLTGQLLLDFETRELEEKVRVMPERNAGEWFALALECESDPATHPQAMEAYQEVIKKSPEWIEAHINLGTLLYEQGEREQAAEKYRHALTLDPVNPLAHFNLGSVLEELEQLAEARAHLREAVRLKPDYADAHFNLAMVAEKLGARAEARTHWRRYLALDPDSPWGDYARRRLGGRGARD